MEKKIPRPHCATSTSITIETRDVIKWDIQDEDNYTFTQRQIRINQMCCATAFFWGFSCFRCKYKNCLCSGDSKQDHYADVIGRVKALLRGAIVIRNNVTSDLDALELTDPEAHCVYDTAKTPT